MNEYNINIAQRAVLTFKRGYTTEPCILYDLRQMGNPLHYFHETLLCG